MPAPTGAFLLFLVIASGVPARAAQMEGPTVYWVEPSNAVISDDGSEAYYVKSLPNLGPTPIESTLIRLNLKQSVLAKIDLDRRLTSKEFAPTGELIGWNKGNIWAYDRGTHALRIVFTAPTERKIRYATVQSHTSSVWVSLAPIDHSDDSSEETLSLSIHDLVKLTWNGKQVEQEQIDTRREVLPPGAVFDNSDVLFFPMRDVYQCQWHEELDGGRCLPVSTERVFTGGGSPSTFAVHCCVQENDLRVYKPLRRERPWFLSALPEAAASSKCGPLRQSGWTLSPGHGALR